MSIFFNQFLFFINNVKSNNLCSTKFSKNRKLNTTISMIRNKLNL